MSEKREPTFWSWDDVAEELWHEDKDEAIEARLESLGELPAKLTMYGYAREVLDRDKLVDQACSFNGPLEDLLTWLDEDHGNPEEATDPTPAMLEAERVFVRAVLGEYTTWSCEVVCEEEVDVRAWVEVHHPEWINGEDDERCKWEAAT